jgi:hypothetical protein
MQLMNVMCNAIIVELVLTFVLVSVDLVNAQNTEAVHRAVESAMVAAAPGWQAEPIQTQSSNYYQRVWRRAGNERLVISYSQWETTEKATDTLHQQLRKVSVGGLSEARGFGDEAYLLSKYTPDGASCFFVRKERVVLEVSSTDESLVRRAARRVVQELDLAATP